MSEQLEQFRMLIGGKAVDAMSGGTFGSENPYTGRPWAVIPDAGPEDVDAAVTGYVTSLLRGGPTALAGTKKLVLGDLDDSDERYAALLDLSATQFASPEAREGARSFAEKRPPAWGVG